MDKYIGRLLDNRYEILEVIGTGGMSVVYKARCHRLNRLVAIKILKDDYFQDDDFRRRFHAESQAVAMLNHPNIVSVYDVSTDGDADYIVMELVDGITLKQYMERRGGYLNWKETLHFAMQIGRALEHAHNQGIVHRDIKPHNVMILKNGSAKVTDFGIARVMSSQNTLTKEALGSVHYISPEQAKGGRVDSRSDIYSLGVVMYEMLTGRPPYDGESPVAVALQHINGGAPMPSTLNPNIPGGLEQIIMRCMSVDPDQRYTSSTAMLYDMEEFRQNPNVLFPYGMVGSQSAYAAQPRTAAQRAAAVSQPRQAYDQQGSGRPGGANGGRPAGARPANPNGTRPSNGSRSGTSSRPPQGGQNRSRRPEPEKEEKGKGMMIALIACGATLLVALIILLVMVSGKNRDDGVMVEVPRFIGQIYEQIDAKDYPNLVIVDDQYTFHDEYPAGEVISQDPEPKAQVKAGTEVKLVISLGVQTDEMPDLTGKAKDNAKGLLDELSALSLTVVFDEEYNDEVKEGLVTRTEPAAGATLTKGQTVTLWISKGALTMVMDDLTGKTKADAQVILDGKKDMKLNVQFKEEASEEVEEGKVIRTEPAKGKEVKAGDTVVVFVSTGSDIVMAKVPKVEGLDISKASSILRDNNLKCEYETVDSNEPKDQVLTQDVKKGTEVPEGTVINLTISAGPKATNPPKPTEPQVVSKTVIFQLPSDITVPYQIQVYRNGDAVADSYQVEPGTTEVPMSLEGSGVVYFDFYVNGKYAESFRVDFGAEGSQKIQLEFTVSE